MNKAFVREPEPDGRAFCPACGTQGLPVSATTLRFHVQPQVHDRLGKDAWFCPAASCECAYFDLLDRTVQIGELQHSVYPKSTEAPICPCFAFTMDDLDQAIESRSPQSIRDLLAKSKSKDANCALLSASGRCCMQEVQRLYIRGVQS